MRPHPIAGILPAYTFCTSTLLLAPYGMWWCACGYTEFTVDTRTAGPAEQEAEPKHHRPHLSGMCATRMGGCGTVYRAFCAQPVHVKVSGQFTIDKPSLASNWVERNGSVGTWNDGCPTKLEGTAEDVVEGFTYFQYLMRAQGLQGKRRGAWSAPSCAAVSNVTFQAVAQ